MRCLVFIWRWFGHNFGVISGCSTSQNGICSSHRSGTLSSSFSGYCKLLICSFSEGLWDHKDLQIIPKELWHKCLLFSENLLPSHLQSLNLDHVKIMSSFISYLTHPKHHQKHSDTANESCNLIFFVLLILPLVPAVYTNFVWFWQSFCKSVINMVHQVLVLCFPASHETSRSTQ